MPRALRVPLDAIAAGARHVSGPPARYMARVHRLEAGSEVCFFDPERGTEARATLLEVGKDAVTCQIGAVSRSSYRAYPFTLVQGLAKGDRPDATLRDATALGVERILFVETERSVVRAPAERKASRLERWRRIAVEAARQCGRGDIPALEGPLPLGLALPRVESEHRLLLAPGAPALFSVLAAHAPGQSIALLVGPEGGFEGREIKAAEAHGFRAAALGSTILRSELCGAAALGALVAFCERHGMTETHG